MIYSMDSVDCEIAYLNEELGRIDYTYSISKTKTPLEFTQRDTESSDDDT